MGFLHRSFRHSTSLSDPPLDPLFPLLPDLPQSVSLRPFAYIHGALFFSSCLISWLPLVGHLPSSSMVPVHLLRLHQVSTVARQLRRFAFHPEEALSWLLTDF